METIENLQQIKSDYLKKCEKTILLFLFRHIFISREITLLLAPFLLSNYIYIYVYIHVYRRYIKKGMESKLNPITSVSSVDTACSGEFIFNGIRGDGKCRGLPSNEICPREREREREGVSFVSEKVSLRGSRIFQRLGRVLSPHRKSNTMVIRAKTPSILRFTSSDQGTPMVGALKIYWTGTASSSRFPPVASFSKTSLSIS